MNTVIDFAAARRRIESHAALHDALAPQVVEIEIAADRIPLVPAYRPTLLEQFARTLTDAQLAELVTVTLEECK